MKRAGRRSAVLRLSVVAALAWVCTGAAEAAPTFVPVTPAAGGCSGTGVANLLAYVAGKPAGAGLVLHGGAMCASWGNIDQKYDIKSATKSLGSVLLGLALLDQKLGLDTKARFTAKEMLNVPAGDPAWRSLVTYRMLATQSSGFTKPGDFGQITFKPGTKWAYSDGGANWIADGLTSIYRKDLKELAFDRVFDAIGIARTQLSWRTNAYRPRTLNGVERREFGGGVSVTTEAMARIGTLFLDGGAWDGVQLIDPAFVAQVGKPQAKTIPLKAVDPAYAGTGAPKHYGILWWTNGDGAIAGLPSDAFWAWGLGEALILVVPSLDIVATRAGLAWQQRWLPDYTVVGPFFQKVAAVVG